MSDLKDIIAQTLMLISSKVGTTAIVLYIAYVVILWGIIDP